MLGISRLNASAICNLIASASSSSIAAPKRNNKSEFIFGKDQFFELDVVAIAYNDKNVTARWFIQQFLKFK